MIPLTFTVYVGELAPRTAGGGVRRSQTRVLSAYPVAIARLVSGTDAPFGPVTVTLALAKLAPVLLESDHRPPGSSGDGNQPALGHA